MLKGEPMCPMHPKTIRTTKAVFPRCSLFMKMRGELAVSIRIFEGVLCRHPESGDNYGIDFIAPTRVDYKWRTKEKQGFDASNFQMDWQAQKATCSTAHESLSWSPT